MPDPIPTRRHFLARAAALLAALPLLGAGTRAFAAPLPKLPPTHPQAKALHYVEDARKASQPTYKPGSACLNCQFYTAATGACVLFAGFSVAPKGWCSAWAKKA